jgi:LuxR family maltose regulon positive regulatory protein
MEKDKPRSLIIETKLNRPLIPDGMVPRTQLLRRLDKHRSRPLTLVSAPAGYGKSILISSWLEASDCPGAWVSLDKNDNNLRLFITYFLAAVNRLFPEAGKKTWSLLKADHLPPVSVLAHTLINEVAQIEQSFILVLDDYYFIQETSIHNLLTEILNHPLQSMHLVVVTRHDPPLPLFRYRAGGQMTEIGIRDLRFSVPETKAFLHNLLTISVDNTMVAALNKKTEGWVTGIHLTTLAMRHRGDTYDILLEPQADVNYVMEYLFNEVFAHQPPEFKQYLLASAIPDRFCGPLCQMMCMPGVDQGACEMDGWQFIAQVKRENLFLINLDKENQWFRYHHLFRKFLDNQLQRYRSAGEISLLHSQASEWFAENDLIDEAFQHALATGDMNRAAQLVEQNRQAELNADRWYVLENWLSMLPDTVIQQRPALLLAQVWIHYYNHNHPLIGPILDLIESLLGNEPDEQPLYGEIYLFKGITSLFLGNGAESLKYLEEALDRIPGTNPMIRGVVEVYFGLAGQMQGQKERVVHVLSDLLHRQPLHDLRKVHVLVALVCVNIISGDLTVAATLNQQLRSLVIRINSAAFIAWNLYFQGLIHFNRNELDMAILHLGQAEEVFYTTMRRGKIDCLAGMALAYQAGQQTDKAAATMERLFEYKHSLSDPALWEIVDSCKVHLSLMEAEAPFAPHEPGINKTPNGEGLLFWLEIPRITYCRVLLAEGSDAGLQEAEKKLQECLLLCQDQHNTLQMIGIMVLQALALQKQGRTDEALAVLEEAVDLARPGGFIRPFVESGPTVEGLLKRLAEKNIALDYIGQLLAAFPPTPHPRSSIGQPLDEHLTNRELQILDKTMQLLTNKEIGANLCIAPGTVKTHLKNIYRKLNVNTRRQAIVKANTLGILSSVDQRISGHRSKPTPL